MMKIFIAVLICYCLLPSNFVTVTGGVKNGLVLLSGCTCLGYTITFECTVFSGFRGATVWKGNAFDCARSDNEVVLLHSRIDSNERTQRTCNNGSIIGETIQVVGNCYTSRLHVMVSPDLIGEEIECISDNGTVMVVGSSTITATMVPFQPPKGLSIICADLGSRQLIFSWSPVAPDCPAVHYNILASNCGSCPTTTNHTNVTCTNVPTDGSVCTFAVQSIVCGDIAGNFSESIEGVLKGNSGCIGATVAAILFSLISFMCVVVYILSALIIIVVKRKKHNINVTSRTTSDSRCTPSIYGHVHIVQQRPVSINTKSNIAYTPTTVQSQLPSDDTS